MSLNVIVLLLSLFTDPGDIGKINSAKAQARKAYLAGDYKTAISKYKFLVDSVGVTEEEVMMNLANSYFQVNDTAQAVGLYQPLIASQNQKIKSNANLQMGVMTNRQGKYEEALSFFKQSLKADPSNDDARYNYEMVKKKIEEEKKKEDQKKQDQKNQDKKDNQDKDSKDDEKKDKKDQENQDKKKEQENKDKQDQEKKDQKDQDKKDKEQQKKDEQQKEQENKDKDQKEIPPSVSDKLKDMNMTEDKAKMILEAMKNQEIQYLQQNKKKATKPKDRSKPDW